MDSFNALANAPHFIAFTDADRWRPGIGDPTFMGWFTAFAYLATAWLCWRVASKGAVSRNLRYFWNGLAILLLLLGINKQLDLQTELTFLGRDFAKATGWYEERRIFQAIFIVFVALFGGMATVGLCWLYRKEMKRIGVALAGFGFLVCFVIVRAASFHHVDRLINFAPGGVRMNWILELGGIGLIAWPAWRASRPNTNTGFVLARDTAR